MTLKNLQHLSDEELLRSTDRAMQTERSQTTVVLLHLIEVEDRRLYARDHDSFFSFLTEGKGYAAGCAQRRIDGAALLREIPALGVKLDQATLNLSILSLARQFFRNEKKFGKKYSTEDKIALLKQLEGKSVRAALRLLLDLSSAPESLKPKRELRPLRNGKTELRLELGEETLAKFERLRDLLAHTVRDGDRVQVLEKLMDVALEKLDPLKKAERAKAREEKRHARQANPATSTSTFTAASTAAPIATTTAKARTSDAGSETGSGQATVKSLKANGSSSIGGVSKHESDGEGAENSNETGLERSIFYEIDSVTGEEQLCWLIASGATSSFGVGSRPLSYTFRESPSISPSPSPSSSSAPLASLSQSQSEPRSMQASVRHHTVLAAQGGCDHIDSRGRRCGSHRGLELDHRVPYALGGRSGIQNARLLCRVHNLYHATRAFGPELVNKIC